MIQRRKRKTHGLFLRAYRLFLEGAIDAEIVEVGLTVDEIHKVKQFHKCMREGRYFFGVGDSLGIEKNVSNKMLTLFEEHQSGLPLSYGEKPSGETHPRIISAFSMLLDGASDEKMKAHHTEYEITKAKQFLKYADASDIMLSTTIAMKIGILQSTVKALLKLYRKTERANYRTAEYERAFSRTGDCSMVEGK